MSFKSGRASDCHFHRDLFVRVVTEQFEMLELEIIDIFDGVIYLKVWESIGPQSVQSSETLDMITIYMHISEHVDEFSSLKACNLSYQASQQ